MTGATHQLVANLSLACLSIEQRHILYPRWGGIESGATLSDEFRIMWEPESIDSPKRQLVHRCFIDSDQTKDHGCVTRAWDHAEGSMSFIQEYLNGGLGTAYTEDEFLENLGMFLGIVSHHISDLCTPVHVGHKMDYAKVGSPSHAHFHRRVERDIDRLARRGGIVLYKPKKVVISREYFWRIAEHTYEHLYIKLGDIYSGKDAEQVQAMASEAVGNSMQHTANVWHSILLKSGMLKRKWSMQPLL